MLERSLPVQELGTRSTYPARSLTQDTSFSSHQPGTRLVIAGPVFIQKFALATPLLISHLKERLLLFVCMYQQFLLFTRPSDIPSLEDAIQDNPDLIVSTQSSNCLLTPHSSRRKKPPIKAGITIKNIIKMACAVITLL